MSIPVPGSINSNIISEYAATNTSITRAMAQGSDGFISPIYTMSINYAKKSYVVDANNNKLGIVTTQDTGIPLINSGPGGVGPGGDSFGFLQLSAADLMPYLGRVAVAGELMGNVIEDTIDSLIQADLVKRGILNA
jgi:hypothetical protein